jgi:hypothetical protein
MMEYEFTDPQGNRFCFRKGFGPKVYHPENLCSGTPYSAELILNRFDDQVIDSGFDHFYFDVLSRLPNYSPQRRITMARALADNHLILEKLKSLPEVVPDNRSILRVQIRNALRSIVEDEKREAAIHQRQMDKESTLMKGLIYTGAFMTGIGSSAWGLAVQAKEISDVINPFVKMQHHATALRTAWESDDFANTYTETYLSGEKRELVEAIGFDPSQITQQQIDEAIAMADLVLNDDSLRDILYGFVKDYAEAQHAIEITRVAGSGAFELILTIIVAAVTGGAGVVAAVGSKMHLVRKFKGVGEHLVEFAKASRSIKKAKKESQGQNTGPGKFESEAGSAKQTNPHGAEDGKISKKRSKKVEPQSLAEAEAILEARRKEIAANGYQPKYSDAELKEMAETGDIGSERFQVRFMESTHLTHKDTKDIPLSGALGRPMKGESGTGAKYWSTSFDQLEDADSDPKLISEKLGLTYNPSPKVKYALVIVDTQVAAPMTGVKSVSATFKNVGEFANTELPKKFPKEFTDKAMTPEFQAQYSKHYKDAEASGILDGDGNWNSDNFREHLDTTDLSESEKSLMTQRFEMHRAIGNNEDYLGNGLTKNNNPAIDQEYGAVETLNFERNEVNLSQLKEQNAISVMPELSRI